MSRGRSPPTSLRVRLNQASSAPRTAETRMYTIVPVSETLETMRQTGIELHAVDEGGRLAEESPAPGVERLCHERRLGVEQELAVGVHGVRDARHQESRLSAVDRCEVDAVRLGVAAGVIGGEIEEVPPVGQEERPAVRGVLVRVDRKSVV